MTNGKVVVVIRGGGITVSTAAVVRVNPPPVPVTIKVNVPGSAVFDVVSVSVEEPEPVMLGGLNVAVAPDPKPVALRFTVPANPFIAVTVTM